jgi:hypothetical protein
MKIEYREVIRKVAEQEGITEDEVYEKIKLAISLGYNDPNPVLQKYWRKTFPEGEIPSPEKFIEIIAQQLAKK